MSHDDFDRHPGVPDLGAILPTMAARGEELGDLAASAQLAERLGLESVWVIDQLIGGTGLPIVDSVVAAAVAAGATNRIRLGIGVLIVPLRPVVWTAKQIASLQQVSNGRMLIGVGAGDDRHDQSWAAAGVPRRERGRRTDEALAVLPALIRGEPAELPDVEGHPSAQLSPQEPLPPLLVGGMSDAALGRVVEHGDGWFLFPVPPREVAVAVGRLHVAAEAAGRPVPSVTAQMLVAAEGDPALPDHEALMARLTDVEGAFGMTREGAESLLVRGGPELIAQRLIDLGKAGADRVVASIPAGDWGRQVALIADAHALALKRDT